MLSSNVSSNTEGIPRPPTREELLAHYPARFTWMQLKTFINSGDLRLIRRDKRLQVQYEEWTRRIKEKYGSMVNYLLSYRLQWGKPDTLSVRNSTPKEALDTTVSSKVNGEVPATPTYFTANAPPELISIIMNDWPYSVPPEVEHTLVWTSLPMHRPDIPSSVASRIRQYGLWGFTGSVSPPPSPSELPKCLPALAEWGVTADQLMRAPQGTDEEEALFKQAGKEVDEFVRRRWKESEWETAWFVNPQVTQSVPGLAHFHVFARPKSPEETAQKQLSK